MGKILYCASTWSHIQQFHLHVIDYLRLQGQQVHIAACDIPNNTPNKYCHNLPMAKKFFSIMNIAAVFRFARLLRKEKFDTIYLNTSLAAFLCRIALCLSFIKNTEVIYICHGYFFTDEINSAFFRLCEQVLSPITNKVIVMNSEDYRLALKYKLGDKIYKINGMGLLKERYTSAPKHRLERHKARLNIPQDAFVFLSVGEFSKRKNQRELIEAFAKLQDKNCYLLLVGQGKQQSICKRLAQKLGVAGRVIFTGQVDVCDYYQIADAFVSSSVCEGLPFCVMEALHYHLPIIASNIKGHIDLIKHNQNGLLYDISNKKQLAQWLELFLQSNSLVKRLSSHSNLANKYYKDTVLKQIKAIISIPV